MKLSIDRAALLRSLGHVQSVVERRNTVPVLANVLLRADAGRLSLTATDMDVEIVEAVPAEVQQPGATTAPAHTLFEIARKLPDGAVVSFEGGLSGKPLTVSAGRSKFDLACLPVDDYPQMSGGAMPHGFAVPAADLRRLIDRTRFAISTEETRYYLNGIFLHAVSDPDGPALRAVATDGHRLARVETALPQGAETMPGIILPRKTVGELRKLIDEAAGTIAVELSETKIRFTLDDIVLTSKLIDGTFPDYARVIPAGNDKRLEVDPRLFASAVDRVATVATDKSRAVKLSLAPRFMVISASSTDAGSAREELEIDYEAGKLEIGFNAKYLLDIAPLIEGQGIVMEIADGASPTVIRDTGNDASLYVLMPMRV